LYTFPHHSQSQGNFIETFLIMHDSLVHASMSKWCVWSKFCYFNNWLLILNKLAIIFGTSNQIKDFKLSVGPSVLKQLISANFLSVKILQQLLIFWKLCKLKKLRALPMFTNFYQCLPIFATVYQSFPILSRYFTVFTNVYLCLPMMWQCLPIISKHWLILVKTVNIG